MTASMLKQIMPALPLAKAEAYLPFLLAGMAEFGINNELRAAAYLAQLAEESNQLTHWVEDLNYSPQRLTEVWHNRFPTLAAAAPFAHNPQKLAEKVYGNRRDLGNSSPGDGWLFRGRMPMQATGRAMYALLSKYLGVNLLANPDSCLKPEIAFRASACIFARIKNCNPLADGLIQSPNNFTLITKRINGGTTGLSSRYAFYLRARKTLPDNLRVDGEEITFVNLPPGAKQRKNSSSTESPVLAETNAADPKGALQDNSVDGSNQEGTDNVSIPDSAPGSSDDASGSQTTTTSQTILQKFQRVGNKVQTVTEKITSVQNNVAPISNSSWFMTLTVKGGGWLLLAFGFAKDNWLELVVALCLIALAVFLYNSAKNRADARVK